MTTKYTVTNFYNNNLILIVYRWWSTKYVQWLLWLQYNILKKNKVTTIFTDELTQPVACRVITTRWLSAKRLVARNVLISHAPTLKSKMRTDPKSGYTKWMQNYCPVKLWTDNWRNAEDWVKSFPKNVKVDQHLGCFRRMSRWTLLHL